MKEAKNFLEIYKRLRNGESVQCDICNKGHLVTPYDYKTSHYFECSHCKTKLIMEKMNV